MKALKPTTPAEMYDWALKYAHDKHLPLDYPRPKPTKEWPCGNVAVLEKYCRWLAEGGTSLAVIRSIYLPMAGHILGLALKPYQCLDLDNDLQRGLDFLKAKQLSAQWMDVCRCAMYRFRRFLIHQRGLIEIKISAYDTQRNTRGLPDWLVAELTCYQHVKQCNWRPSRLEDAIRRFWTAHLTLWHYLCDQCQVKTLVDIKRLYLHEYIDLRLNKGRAISSINHELRSFHSFMVFLQDQGYTIPQVLMRMYTLKEPDPLPKFLSDEQVKLLRDEIENNVLHVEDYRQLRDSLLIRAAFYLLWQSGMRLGEVEELRLENLDLPGRKIIVREGKNFTDRAIYMTDHTVRALEAYLAVRGAGPTDHVFLYRNQPISKDFIRIHIKEAGNRVGVKVHPHRLRHTSATQLLNSGCRITSIQKFLGHKELNTTMIYARVHDQTVADDYFSAMRLVEKRLELPNINEEANVPIGNYERTQLIYLAGKLTKPELSTEERMQIASTLRDLLVYRNDNPVESSMPNSIPIGFGVN